MEAHPVGDDENRPQKATPATVKAMVVDTRSGRIQVYPGIKNRQPPPLVSWYSLPSFRKSAVCFLLLDVEVMAGNTTASNHARPGLNRVLDSLSAEQRPYLVCGDCGFGNDAVIREMETRQQAYLFKLRQSPRVKRLLQRAFTRRDWMSAGQGWEGREDSIQLAGWQQSRRVVILRRLLKQNLIATQEQQGQLEFAFVDRRQTKVYEYAVLVTDLKESILGIAQLYRDRADAENGFDELKNQWGWAGTAPVIWRVADSPPAPWG